MSRTVSFSIPEEAYARIRAEAEACGFFGKYAASSFARYALFQVADVSDDTVAPIVARPRTKEKRQEIDDYSLVKGHESAEAFALHAMTTVMSKNKLTPTQKTEIARIHGMEVA